MQRLAYTVGADDAVRLGLIVLSTDTVLEAEWAQMAGGVNAVTHYSRIRSAPTVTEDHLAAMADDLTASAALLPEGMAFSAVGYGCTSASTVMGADKVEALVKAGVATEFVTNPFTAMLAACRSLNVRRLAFLTPYIETVSARMRQAVIEHGIEIAGSGSFMAAEEAIVRQISPDSIVQAALSVIDQAPCDAIFLSCTNLPALKVIEEIEQARGVPVITSNQALAWHMFGLAGLPSKGGVPGLLGRTPMLA